MKETILGAGIAAIISFFTAVLALLTQPGVETIGDIGQLPWIVAGIGALISFLKDYQALSTRRLISNITGGQNE